MSWRSSMRDLASTARPLGETKAKPSGQPDEFWNLVENLRCQRTGDPVESAHTKLDEYVEDLMHARSSAATAEAKASIDRLAEILRHTVNAIRGEPPESIAWGWKDLHEQAATLVSERDALASRVRELEGSGMRR